MRYKYFTNAVTWFVAFVAVFLIIFYVFNSVSNAHVCRCEVFYKNVVFKLDYVTWHDCVQVCASEGGWVEGAHFFDNVAKNTTLLDWVN